MSATHARELFATDTEKAVFRASLDEGLAMCLYPRKSEPGYVYCIWQGSVLDLGLDAIVEGGLIGLDMKSFEQAALKATEIFLFYCAAKK